MAINLWRAGVIFTQILGLSASLSHAEQTSRKSILPKPAITGPAVSIAYTKTDDFHLNIYLTGYSFWDNTPPGSAAIAKPVIHRKAGGTGTYRDPVTVAVGHTNFGGRRSMDFPAGTRFYFPSLQKYGIVEDLCGDGNSPQNGPCHSGHKGLVWLDIYVGGRSTGQAAANNCMYSITGVQKAILNPSRNYRVSPGEIATSHCGYSG